MPCTLFGVPILLAAGTTAQYAQFGGFNGAYPTGNGYGQMAGYIGGGFGGYMGGGLMGGYGGEYGRQCRSNVRSEDLRGALQHCFCDKNHRDEDPCEGAPFESSPSNDNLETPAECRRDFPKYYDDVFDEDCVQPSQMQRPTSITRCSSKIKSRDLVGQAVCLCDSDHVKEWENENTCEWADRRRRNLLGHYPLQYAGPLDEGWAILIHYQKWDQYQVDEYTDLDGGSDCDGDDDYLLQEEIDAFDPNCFERFGGYGGYGGYGQQFGGYGGFGMGYNAGYGQQFGGYGMGYNAGYGQQFGGNMFYPTSMQPAAAAPVDGATPAPAPTFQFQAQQFGGFPQQQMYGGYGGYGGYRQQQMYYGR